MTGGPLPSPPARSAAWRTRYRRIVIALVAVLTCVVLLCCAGAGYVLYNAQRAPGEEREMEAFANELCRDLLDGDADAVYAALSADARERYSPRELAQGLDARGGVTRCNVVRATYLFLLLAYVVIEDADGQHSFDLVSEAGEWRVDGDILHDLDSPPAHGGGGGGWD